MASISELIGASLSAMGRLERGSRPDTARLDREIDSAKGNGMFNRARELAKKKSALQAEHLGFAKASLEDAVRVLEPWYKPVVRYGPDCAGTLTPWYGAGMAVGLAVAYLVMADAASNAPLAARLFVALFALLASNVAAVLAVRRLSPPGTYSANGSPEPGTAAPKALERALRKLKDQSVFSKFAFVTKTRNDWSETVVLGKIADDPGYFFVGKWEQRKETG